MPQEILDDINCSVTSIPSVQELNASTNSDVKESSDYEKTATVSHSNETEHERIPCDELPSNSENALINLLSNVVQELEKNGKLDVVEKKFRLINSKKCSSGIYQMCISVSSICKVSFYGAT